MVFYKSKEEIDLMKKSGEVISILFKKLEKIIKPGITTIEIDMFASELIKKYGAKPSFLNYGKPPFPAAVCTSVNNEVVHGIPSRKRILNNGDIISIDAGAYLNGFHSDAARTFPVGEISPEAEKLIKVTKECFFIGVKELREGNRISDVSIQIERHARAHGYGIVHELTGHGIGRNLHESPDVPNFKTANNGLRIREGLVVAIEPMINLGSGNVKILDDEWTIATTDGSLSAHYENTVAVTKEGPLILTEM